MNSLEFDFQKCFEYENGFYLTSDVSRLGKMLAHYEIFQKLKEIPGDIVELGVFKGISLVRWATFRNLFENESKRKIYGFDIYGEFPETGLEDDKKIREDFINDAGASSISIDDLYGVFEKKGLKNVELIKGDILKTVPDFMNNNNDLKISLLHVDVDIYEPSKVILENMYDSVVDGGIILLDDYGHFHGETKAVDEFFAGKDVELVTFPFLEKSPSYIIKRS